MTRRAAQFEMDALMVERQLAMQDPDMPLHPSMEQVFQRLPALRAGLPHLRALILRAKQQTTEKKETHI